MSREVMQMALENCRLLAARHRNEDWAKHILRFCEEGEVKAEVLREALEQPQESTHSADCYKWHHECAKAEVERLRERNPWKDAIDHELVQIESAADSYDDPAKALNDLIHWHVCVATDPKVNGGFALVPVEAGSALQRMGDNAHELGLDYEAKNPLGGPAKIFDAMADSIRAGDDYHATLKRFGYAEQISSEPLANQSANQAKTSGSPVKEPVAWLDEEINCAYTPEELDGGSAEGLLPLYTTPPRRKNVTYVCPVCAASLERQE